MYVQKLIGAHSLKRDIDLVRGIASRNPKHDYRYTLKEYITEKHHVGLNETSGDCIVWLATKATDRQVERFFHYLIQALKNLQDNADLTPADALVVTSRDVSFKAPLEVTLAEILS